MVASTLQDSPILKIEPNCFSFTEAKSKVGFIARLHLANPSKHYLAFKFKTNNSKKFSVKPVMGILKPDQDLPVFARSETGDIDEKNERFLLQYVPVDAQMFQDVLYQNQPWIPLTPLEWKALDTSQILDTIIECRRSRQSPSPSSPTRQTNSPTTPRLTKHDRYNTSTEITVERWPSPRIPGRWPEELEGVALQKPTLLTLHFWVNFDSSALILLLVVLLTYIFMR